MNNKNNILSNSQFCDILTSSLLIAVRSQNFSFYTVNSFINAFMQHNRIKFTSKNVEQVLFKFIAFYIAYYLMHDSKFVTYLHKRKIFLTIPAFTHVHLLKICMEVDSRNKYSGFSRGKLYSSSSLEDIRSIILGLHASDLRRIFIDSDFSTLFESDEYCIQFPKRFLKFLDEFIGDKSTFEFIVSALALPCNMVLYSDKFDLFRGVLDFGVSKTLGIYRFRDENVPAVYSVDQSKLNGLSTISFDLLLNFLFLYRPNIEITEGGNHISRPGDTRLDLDIVEYQEVWYQYFNVTSSSPRGRDSDGAGTKAHDIVNVIPRNNHNDDDILAMFHNVSVAVGDYYYIPIRESTPYRGFRLSELNVLHFYETNTA